MEVRCLEVYEGSSLKVGEVYTIDYEIGDSYVLVVNGIRVQALKKRFEIVIKDNRKTFREVIADIKEGEVWENSLRKIELVNGDIQISRINGKEFNTHVLQFSKSITYKLKRNKYNFNEAFKSYEDGIKVESKFSGISYEKIYGGLTRVTSSLGEAKENDNEITFSTGEIRGEWYIHE